MTANGLHVGAEVGTDGTRGERVVLDPAEFTTHGVIVGMTGSGKTGLGVVLLEEALRSGIPVLAIDPKGDLGNLALRFPNLRPADFAPWVDPDEARRGGVTIDQLAATTATSWKEGLAGWGYGAPELAALHERDVTIYTPGSTAGVPVNVLGSLAAPTVPFDDDAEVLREQISGFISGLLGMIDVAADPVSSPEHVLLSLIVETSWRAGRNLDLAGLIGQLLTPPVRRIGVFDVEDFFPADARRALAMKLNTLVASPAFASWMQGEPLDPATMLWDAEGAPRAAVVTLAHLSDKERQFVVTLLLGRVVTWMRSQPGSSSLRALIYMDEVAGYVPPVAAPPSKGPILTLLKQARAFGVGLVVATQNPVDLDYKALSNAGTWMVGRLQTEQDRARLLDGLSSAAGGVDVAAVGDQIAGLAKRRFVLHRQGVAQPTVFEVRWAMSFLRGPLTREQIASLMKETPRPTQAPPAEGARPAAADASNVAPPVAPGLRVAYLDPAAPWASDVGAVPGGSRYEAAVAARVHLRFDDAKAGVDHDEEWESIWSPVSASLEPADLIVVDHDERDFLSDAPSDVTHVPPDAPIGQKNWPKEVAADLKRHLVRSRSEAIWRNPKLNLYSRIGESREEFAARCEEAADTRADAEAAKLADRLQDKVVRAEQALQTAQQRVDAAAADAQERRRAEMMGGAGALLGVLLGGRSRSIASRAARSLGGAASRRATSARSSTRVESLELAVTQRQEALQGAQDALTDEVAEISDRWAALAGEIEEVPIGLEATDVQVEDIFLVWIPKA